MCCRYFWDESMLSEVMYDLPDVINRMSSSGMPATGMRAARTAADGMPAGKTALSGSRDVLPTDLAPVICSGRADGRDGGGARANSSSLILQPASWGFPYTHEGQNKLAINARCETAATKRLFSQAMHENRCVVPVSAFYEYTADKQKVRFDGERPVLYLAGCMRAEHFVILTREPDETVAPVHDRMPLLIAKEDVEEWIEAKNVPSRLMGESTIRLTASAQYRQMSLFDL